MCSCRSVATSAGEEDKWTPVVANHSHGLMNTACLLCTRAELLLGCVLLLFACKVDLTITDLQAHETSHNESVTLEHEYNQFLTSTSTMDLNIHEQLYCLLAVSHECGNDHLLLGIFFNQVYPQE